MMQGGEGDFSMVLGGWGRGRGCIYKRRKKNRGREKKKKKNGGRGRMRGREGYHAVYALSMHFYDYVRLS